MEPRRFPLVARLGGCALSLVLALAACTDRELPTAVPKSSDRPSMLVAPEGARLVSVATGLAHSCALKVDGTAECWGLNTSGQATAPAGTFTQLSAGSYHTCGVKTDGTVACWGDNSVGQLNVPASLGVVRQISTNFYQTCAVRIDATLVCWGRNDAGQSSPPAGSFAQVGEGFLHGCAVKTDGTVTCWGSNSDGQATPPAGTFSQVSAGSFHSCGVKSDGTVGCWGRNFYGETDAPAGAFIQVTAGQFYTCGVRTDGTIACWGNNSSGQATPPVGTFTQVSVNDNNGCGVRSDGTVACWGANVSGATTSPSGAHNMPGVSAGGTATCAVRSDGTATCWGSPTDGQTTPPGGSYVQVDAGGFHGCGVKSDGTVACWGNNAAGQATPPAGTFSRVSAGGIHSCGLKSDGTVACWGSTSLGQATPPAGTFSQVSAGGSHSCGLKSDGTVRCWGANFYGQATPPAGTFSQVSAGGNHSCGVKSDGTVVCWGANSEGQTIAPSGTFTQVSAGGTHSCGVKSDGTVACWGANSEGEANAPAGTTFVQVSAGSYYTCGVRSDGTLGCWGSNGYGQATPPADLAGAVPTITLLSVSPGTQQYSDKVSLSASVLPAAATGSVQFRKSIDGGVTFTDLGLPVSVPNAALNDHQILQAAGTAVQFQAVFTATGSFTGSTSDAKSLTVTKENATIGYASTNVAALQVASAGGTLSANSLTLALAVKETSPDLAALTAGLGDIAKAGLTVSLAAVGSGSSYVLTCTPGAVTGSGYAAARPFTCTNPTAIDVNAYEVVATVTGDYFAGTLSDAFTVFDPSLGFATGGGSFVLNGDKVNFGFTMKYGKNGSNLQGNFIAVRHHADGTVSRLKSNALGGLALGEDATVPLGWATFNGKATYTTWNATAGAYVIVGNQSFAVYAEDRSDPGSGIDRIWLGAPGDLAMSGTAATATSNTTELTGGGIAVPHRAKK